VQIEMQVDRIHLQLPAAVEKSATAAAIAQMLIAGAEVDAG
jgi:hypothetical protein